MNRIGYAFPDSVVLDRIRKALESFAWTELARGRVAMSEDMPGKEQVTATANDASADRAISPFLVSSSTMPGTPAPVPQAAARRKRFRHWLPLMLVGVLVLATMIGVLISLLQRPAATAPSPPFGQPPAPLSWLRAW